MIKISLLKYYEFEKKNNNKKNQSLFFFHQICSADRILSVPPLRQKNAKKDILKIYKPIKT